MSVLFFLNSSSSFAAKLFLAFLLYSFIGWAYESFVWAPCEKKEFINRGFLIGPVCPIYGLVCLMDYYLLRSIDHPFAIFCTAMVVCCSCEYLISCTFEKFFHARWWDYSNYAFNLNGRISLYSGVLFGVGGLLLVKVVHPFTLRVFDMIPPYVLKILAVVLFVVFVVDVVVSLISIKSLNRKVSIYCDVVTTQLEKPFDYLNEHLEEHAESLIAQKGSQLLLKFENFNEKMMGREEEIKKRRAILKERQKAFRQKYFSFNKNELHILRAFPDFAPKFKVVDAEHERTLSKVFEAIRAGSRKKTNKK